MGLSGIGQNAFNCSCHAVLSTPVMLNDNCVVAQFLGLLCGTEKKGKKNIYTHILISSEKMAQHLPVLIHAVVFSSCHMLLIAFGSLINFISFRAASTSVWTRRCMCRQECHRCLIKTSCLVQLWFYRVIILSSFWHPPPPVFSY